MDDQLDLIMPKINLNLGLQGKKVSYQQQNDQSSEGSMDQENFGLADGDITKKSLLYDVSKYSMRNQQENHAGAGTASRNRLGGMQQGINSVSMFLRKNNATPRNTGVESRIPP